MKKSILHIIPSLSFGGAEKQLLNLAISDNDFDHTIVTLLQINNNFLKQYDLHSINIIDLSSHCWIKKLLQINRILVNHQPNIIQTWMYHSCLFSLMFLKKNIPIIWNIRRTDISKNSLKLQTYFIVRLLSVLSHLIPSGIVYCANSAKESHLLAKFSNKNSKVIFNGLDLKQNYNNENIKKSEIPKIAFVGRNVKEKNFNSFMKFLDYTEKKNERLEVYVLGRGYERYFSQKSKYKCININFLGEVSNINDFYLKSEFLFSTSLTEGFPNVIAEAMSFGVTPIYSDVGDSRDIANNYGVMINSFNPKSMYSDLLMAFEKRNKNKITEMVSYIRTKYSQESTNKAYKNLWMELINK